MANMRLKSGFLSLACILTALFAVGCGAAPAYGNPLSHTDTPRDEEEYAAVLDTYYNVIPIESLKGIYFVSRELSWWCLDTETGDIEELGIADSPYEDGFAWVKKDGKWGCVNEAGEITVPLQYDERSAFFGGVAPVRRGAYMGYISYYNEVVIPFDYEELEYWDETGWAKGVQDGKAGYVAIGGEQMIPFVYDELHYQHPQGILLAKREGLWGCIDDKNHVLLPFVYDELFLDSAGWRDGMVAVRARLEGRSCQVLVSAAGEVSQYDLLDFWDEEPLVLAVVADKEHADPAQEPWMGMRGHYGYLNKDGTVAVPLVYDFAEPFDGEMARVWKDGHYGYVNMRGETMVPLVYDAAVDQYGQLVVRFPLDYQMPEITEEMRHRWALSGADPFPLWQAGLFDALYGEQTDATYLGEFFDGRALIRKDGRYGFIDQTGAAVIAPIYTHAWAFRDGLAPVEMDGQWGAVNTAGELVVATAWENASDALRQVQNE